MCGLSGYFCRESGEKSEILKGLFDEAAKRGSDGFGYFKYNIETENYEYSHNTTLDFDIENIQLNKGDILISNHRAAPETECSVKEHEREKTLQPIFNEEANVVIVHNGSVSETIVNEFSDKMKTNIDSEAIIHAYVKFGRNMKQTMEYLVGGFAFLLLDMDKKKLYAVCSHNPLYNGYVRGHGLFFSSTLEGVFDTVSYLKNHPVNMNLMAVWEDYYANQMPEYNIVEIDLLSGMCNDYSFEPRYVTSTYDPYITKKNDEIITLVSASGGLDSSTTLAALKTADMNPIAVHFKYGHRGQEAEELAIENITKILDVPLVKFDIEQNMKMLDRGMLTDPTAKITTGTNDGLKTTAAWTVFRNHLFLTYMAGLAESMIMKDNYKNVYITGGFMNLTESGVYPDNSERFVESGLNFFKYSITGTRIKPLYGLCNILKTEQYLLLHHLGYLDKLSPWLVSCDRPIVKDGKPYNCAKNDVPACGSGLLSYWAVGMAGLTDDRNYYEIDENEEYEKYNLKDNLELKQNLHIINVMNKLQLPKENWEILCNEVYGNY